MNVSQITIGRPTYIKLNNSQVLKAKNSLIIFIHHLLLSHCLLGYNDPFSDMGPESYVLTPEYIRTFVHHT